VWSAAAVVLTAAIVVALILLFGGKSTRAAEFRTASQWESDYYTSLKEPDNPYTPCCGVGDAYYADKTEACTPADGKTCALVAIITDKRPDRVVLPSGQTIVRDSFPVGTRVVIPRNKIRRHLIPNPTDHNVVFMGTYGAGVWVYCWEPVAGI
jgi:hypothetical protein